MNRSLHVSRTAVLAAATQRMFTPIPRPVMPRTRAGRFFEVPPAAPPNAELGPITRDSIATSVDLHLRAIPPTDATGSWTFAVDGTLVGQGDLDDDAVLEIAQEIIDRLREPKRL